MNSFHMDVWTMERASELGDRAWFRYVATVERLKGLAPDSLDGDNGDGICLHSAHNAFRAGVNPAEYVREPLEWM